MSRAEQVLKATARCLLSQGEAWTGVPESLEGRSQEDWQTSVDGRLEPTGGPRKRRVWRPAGGDSVTCEGVGNRAQESRHLCEVSGGERRKQKGRGRWRAAGLDSEDGKHGSKKQKHFQWGESP